MITFGTLLLVHFFICSSRQPISTVACWLVGEIKELQRLWRGDSSLLSHVWKEPPYVTGVPLHDVETAAMPVTMSWLHALLLSCSEEKPAAPKPKGLSVLTVFYFRMSTWSLTPPGLVWDLHWW
jgi:hypothetical protein